MKYEAMGKNIIVVLKKDKDLSHGEKAQDSGIILIGNGEVDKKTEAEKNTGEVISVGSEVSGIVVGDVVRVRPIVGDVLDEIESDTEVTRTLVLDCSNVLAKILKE